jgi:hypothetical protein
VFSKRVRAQIRSMVRVSDKATALTGTTVNLTLGSLDD